jgi:putative protease
MSKRYEPVIPRNTRSGHIPGREKAPVPIININETQPAKGGKGAKGRLFPEGLYVAVSRIEDLYILQSSRPAQVMLSLNRKTASYLLSDNKPPLPFKPAGIILVLDPYFPQADAGPLSSEVERLIEKGYAQFMLNNPGHFSLFRSHGRLKLIAGPWLYMFNRWAVSFAASWGVDAFVSPLENNRQNLERTLPSGDNLRSRFFIPVFSYPPLFRIRKDLGPFYSLSSFSSSRNEYFSLITGQEGSVVISETPVSITDKIQFLQEAGFGRFIIDLSGPVLRKSDYRDLMRAVAEKTPLPHISRFNWKDGFFQSNE